MSKHKGQFIATMLVIAVGIMTFMTFRMDEINLKNSLSTYYKDAKFADVFVEMTSVPHSAIEKLNQIEGVEKAEGRIVFDMPIKVEDPDENVNVRIISLSEEEEHVNDVYMYSGDRFKDLNKDAYIIRTFAEARGIAVGDTINPQILGEDYAMTTRAIVASPEFVYVLEDEQSLIQLPDQFGVIYVPEKFAMSAFGMNGTYNTVIVRGVPGYSQEKLKNSVEKALEKYGILRIYKGENQLSNRIVQEEIDQREISSRTMPMIFLAVASVIMVEMMRRNVRNDRVSIGILKSMGYSNFQIMLHYAKYCMMIGVAGGLVGAVLGTVFGAALSEWEVTVYFNIPSMRGRIYMSYIIYSVLGASLLSITAGLFGAREVINIHPAVAMRPPEPKSGRRIWLEKLKVWQYISFSEKIVIRNILRNKKRFLFIVAGIALTYGITIIPMFMSSMWDDMFGNYYSEFLKYDYSIGFRVPMNDSVITELKELVEVRDIDGKIEFPFEIQNGWRKKDVTIIGIDKDTELISFTDLSGNEVALKSHGMYISETLSILLNLETGDQVKINTFIPNREDQVVTVTGVVKQSLGMNAYMDLEYMQDKFMDDNLISGVYLTTSQPIKDELDNAKNINSVQSIGDLQDIFEEFLGLMMASVGTMLFFAGVMGFAIVYNTTIISILERRLEFSSMRIMGFSKNEIFFITLRENMIMTVFGIAAGIPFGRLMIQSMSDAFSSELYRMDANIPDIAYYYTALMVVIYVLAAQLATYSRLRKLDFIEALKNRMT